MTSRRKLLVDLARNRYLYGTDAVLAPAQSTAKVVDDILRDGDDDSGEEFVDDPNLYAERGNRNDGDVTAHYKAQDEDGGMLTYPVNSNVSNSTEETKLVSHILQVKIK